MAPDPAVTSTDDVGRVVRVLIDEPTLNKAFDYFVPKDLPGAELVRIGTIVRVPLHGRRVGGWIVGLDLEAGTASRLKAVTKISGYGPPEELLRLSKWASWRWWGKPAHFLRTASPDTAVRGLPRRSPIDPALLSVPVVLDEATAMTRDAIAHVQRGDLRPQLLRLPPNCDLFPVVLEAARSAGQRGALVIAPSIAVAVHVARRLRRAGAPVALLPDDWAVAAAGGCVVVGSRAAAWAPIASPGAIVVIDEHDETHKEERTPAWNARDVAIERARLLGIPCLLTSPTPSLETRAVACCWDPPRSLERSGWPPIEIVDRFDEDPFRQGLVSERLVSLLRSDSSIVVVLNRTGRAKLLACSSCGEITRCEHCHGALHLLTDGTALHCPRCERDRPLLCQGCGGATLKNLRMGVTRVREELEALALRPVAEVVGSGPLPPDDAPILVGTEAVLHRAASADVVVFLDFDSELFAPRVRSTEQALTLLVHAARLIGRRDARPGKQPHVGQLGIEKPKQTRRIIVQTREPDHPVLRAVVRAEPSVALDEQSELRAELQLPPAAALASVSGAGADSLVKALRAVVSEHHAPMQIGGTSPGPYIVRAPSHGVLCRTFSFVDRPSERVRVEVDPLRM